MHAFVQGHQMSVHAYGGKRRTSKSPELEQEVVVSYHVSPGTEGGSFRKAVREFNY